MAGERGARQRSSSWSRSCALWPFRYKALLGSIYSSHLQYLLGSCEKTASNWRTWETQKPISSDRLLILSAGQIPDIPGRQLQLTWQGNFQIAVSSTLNASETTPPRWGSHTRLLLSFNLNTRQKLCFLSERRHNVIISPACYAHVATGHNDKVNLFFVHVVTGDLSVQLVEVSLLSPLDDTLLTPAP